MGFVFNHVLHNTDAPNALSISHIKLHAQNYVFNTSLLQPFCVLISSFVVIIFDITILGFNKAFHKFFEGMAMARRVLADVCSAKRALTRF